MKVINDLNMPEHAFKAICLRQGRTERPKLDFIGVSTLLGAPLPRFLYARYFDQIEVLASETMNAIQGQLGHLLFDKIETETQTELHLKTDFEGTLLYGIADYYDAKLKTLGDVKFRQVNSVTAGNISKDDYLEKQLNVYHWMARRMGFDVEHLQGDIYINGWVRYKAIGESNYPKAPYQKIILPIWKEAFATDFIRERIAVHNTEGIRLLREIGSANTVSDEDTDRLDYAMSCIPVCTDKERFTQPTKYAVMKEGQKKAVKLCATMAEARVYISGQSETMQGKLSVAERKGGHMKCLFYCDVKQFCPHVKKVEEIALQDGKDGLS